MEHEARVGGGELLEPRQPAAVDLEGVHQLRPLEHRPREQPAGGPDLEDDVLGADRRLVDDGAQDVLVDQVVLAVALERVRARGATAVARARPSAGGAHVSRTSASPKTRRALAVVSAASSSAGTPRTSATSAAVCATQAGTLLLPRLGTGVRNGASVSTMIRSPRTFFAASRSSAAFL